MMAKVYDIVNGTSTKPAESELPAVPTAPENIFTNTAVDVAQCLNDMWTQ